ncbi:protein of unknown function [Pararobbsia alpina]
MRYAGDYISRQSALFEGLYEGRVYSACAEALDTLLHEIRGIAVRHSVASGVGDTGLS